MAKVLQVTNEIVTIGMEDGTLTEVRPCDMNFLASVGDEVEIFQNESKVIVSKIEKKVEPQFTPGANGININVNNSNTNQNTSPVYAANGKKAVNKLVYCLLTFFLGGLGVHKFYAGKIGSGILYILFCWTFIPSFIALIEFIIALLKKPDANGMILV